MEISQVHTRERGGSKEGVERWRRANPEKGPPNFWSKLRNKERRDTILFIGKGGDHRKLIGVYFISRLKANLVSLGQLDGELQLGVTKALAGEPIQLKMGVTKAPVGDPIQLKKEQVFAQIGERGEQQEHQRWVLDTGTISHMTQARSAFSKLDSGICGTMKFGDNFVVEIEGRDTILFVDKGGEHRKLTGVYFILRLKANLVSLGQLDEVGCFISIKRGLLKIYDDRQRLLTQVRRMTNHLYILELEIEQPVSLSAKTEEVSWRWHARYGHLNFPALEKLQKKELVHGLPEIKGVNKLCDGCLIGKQRRTPFPSRTAYRADEPLELVHGDICGPIKPATRGGKTLFLLLVDDKSRFMWLILLQAKMRRQKQLSAFKREQRPNAGRRCECCARTETENSP